MRPLIDPPLSTGRPPTPLAIVIAAHRAAKPPHPGPAVACPMCAAKVTAALAR